MKTIARILIIAVISIFTAEVDSNAQILKNLLNKTTTTSTETVSGATANGQAAGAALKSLYTQYKADGKIDMSNINNMLNLATLATNVKGLKGITNKSTFYKEFATGLVSGSSNLVNSNNTTAVMSGLTNLVNNVDLSALTSTSGTKATTANSEIASSVSGILKLFK